jgi:dynein heavy chain, axonemal
MGELLKQSKSSYFPSFENIQNDVQQALKEAQEIDVYLPSLRGHFESIESSDLLEGKQLFHPMFHIIGLICKNCVDYAKPTKIVVLLQKICNLVMQQVSEQLEPNKLFKGEVDEASEMMNDARNYIRTFRNEYDAVRQGMGTAWDFSSSLVFAKLDKFSRQMDSINELFSTAEIFVKLEKVEIGGVKGN